jgi:hypothetical protein
MWVVRDRAGSVVYRGARASAAMRCIVADPLVTVTRNSRVIYPPPEELDLANPPRD